MHKLLRNLIVVEDSDEDFVALTRALKHEVGISIMRYRDGEEMMSFLERLNREESAIPAESLVVLLDLNLPGTDGRQVLTRIKNSPVLKVIPVVVFSTSNNPTDISYCYANGANGYMVKSVNFSKYETDLRLFSAYWEKAMVLPKDERRSALGTQ